MDGSHLPFPPLMNTTLSSLDRALLHKVRHHASGKITARCPACAEAGADRTGNHLAIFPDGRFACAAHPGDRDHRSRIHALTGTKEADGAHRREHQREWREQAALEARRRQEAARITAAVQVQRQRIISLHPWHPADVWEDSPQRIDGDLTALCPRHFLATLFGLSRSDALLWTGEVHHSGTAHASRWKTPQEWLRTQDATGPMTTPALWRPGTVSRTAGNVLDAPYTVLDFDGFDGKKPSTPAELEEHLRASLSLIRWLRESHRWQLAAILHTGGKSLHAWVHTPSRTALSSLREAAAPLGIDAGLIGRPEHPCRLPGQVHQKTGGISRVLWLAEAGR